MYTYTSRKLRRYWKKSPNFFKISRSHWHIITWNRNYDPAVCFGTHCAEWGLGWPNLQIWPQNWLPWQRPLSNHKINKCIMKRNSGSWFHCLLIRIYRWIWEGDSTAVVCKVVRCMEMRPGLQERKMRGNFSERRWEWCGVKVQDWVPSKGLRERHKFGTAKQVVTVWACASSVGCRKCWPLVANVGPLDKICVSNVTFAFHSKYM